MSANKETSFPPCPSFSICVLCGEASNHRGHLGVAEIDSLGKNLEVDVTHNQETGMSALETFDWFKNEISLKANDEMKKFLEERREYLLRMRNENERRRLIEEIIAEVRAAMKKPKA